MCNIGYRQPDVYRTENRRARKSHFCCECGRTITAGESYRCTTGIWDGFPDRYKTCAHCCIGQDWLIENCNGFMHRQLHEEVQEHADEYPSVRFGMLRLKTGMRRKWARFNGDGLMPIQPTPPPIGQV